MEEKNCHSPIGRSVQVRHATEADLVFIEENLRKNNIDTGNLDYREFVVAAEDGEIMGFGRLRKAGEVFQIGCVVVVEDKRRRGVGSEIIRHLVESTPVKMVYILTDLGDYFTKFGFVEMKEASKELLDALDRECNVRGRPNMKIMVYEKQ